MVYSRHRGDYSNRLPSVQEDVHEARLGEKLDSLAKDKQSMSIEKSRASQLDQSFNEKSWASDQRYSVEEKMSETQTISPWLDWGEPLPPEEFDDEEEIFSAPHQMASKLSLSRTTVDDDSDHRASGSFSSADSLDSFHNELEQISRVLASGNHNKEVDFLKLARSSAELSAACRLVELSNFSNCGEDCQGGEDSGILATFHDASHYLDEISTVVDKIYAAVYPLRMRTLAYSRDLRERGPWTAEMSEDSGKLKMKRVKPDKRADNFQTCSESLESDEDSEVLDRPPSKRQYKSLQTLL